MDKIRKILGDFDKYVTENSFGIYGREDIATAILLTYCSPLRFYFNGRLLDRGWMDILIIGDTRCGKTAIAEGIRKSVRLGEFFKCENTSFAGLVGGLQQIDGKTKWGTVWGRIPVNNGKLLMADEMSSLSIDDISNLSSIRSSGRAEINKIKHDKARAATRMIWLSNPRSEKMMGEYQYGVEAIQELIGRPEDISRFDFAIGVTQTDISADVINAVRPPPEPEPRWRNLRELIRWVWQLQATDVEITKEACEAIMSIAKSQSDTYTSNIPLVEPSEQRIRLARVSAAVAARCFSEHGGGLVVKPRHVEFADYFMRKCFDHNALKYDRYALMLKEINKTDENSYDEMKTFMARYIGGNPRRLQKLMNLSYILRSDIEDIFAPIVTVEARELIGQLLLHGYINRAKNSQYRKTALGTSCLSKMLGEFSK
jgi:hypothetical protein